MRLIARLLVSWRLVRRFGHDWKTAWKLSGRYQ